MFNPRKLQSNPRKLNCIDVAAAFSPQNIDKVIRKIDKVIRKIEISIN